MGLENFRIDRWLGTTGTSGAQLHGFSDVRTEDTNGTGKGRLLISKTRLAPLRTITFPRLELAAVELPSRLLAEVRNSMEWIDTPCFLWSDSSVVLHWIRKLPCDLKTYVANRVSSIQSNTQAKCWHYVNTRETPADLLSRGVQTSALADNKLWLEGPKWLQQLRTDWPETGLLKEWPEMGLGTDWPDGGLSTDASIEVEKEFKVCIVVKLKPQLCIGLKRKGYNVPLLEFTDKLERLVNIVSYVIRFIDNWFKKPTFKIRVQRHKSKVQVPTLAEKARAMAYLLRKSQEEICHGKEITWLKKGKGLPEESDLRPLKPLLDVQHILRVGGRLDRSSNSYEMNHPAIVPNGSRLAWLIVNHAHRNTKHGAVQVMMQFVREKHWIPKLRSELRGYLHKCARYSCKLGQQLMSELPADRVQIGKTFVHCGVDYAGPFEIKLDKKDDQITRGKC